MSERNECIKGAKCHYLLLTLNKSFTRATSVDDDRYPRCAIRVRLLVKLLVTITKNDSRLDSLLGKRRFLHRSCIAIWCNMRQTFLEE